MKKSAKKDAASKQLRYFISSLNTSVGHALVEALRNDHVNDENPHFIVGSLSPHETSDTPRGVFRVVDVREGRPEDNIDLSMTNSLVLPSLSLPPQTTKLMFLSRVLLDSDVVIYDLNTCDLQEAEFAVKSNNNTSSS